MKDKFKVGDLIFWNCLVKDYGIITKITQDKFYIYWLEVFEETSYFFDPEPVHILRNITLVEDL